MKKLLFIIALMMGVNGFGQNLFINNNTARSFQLDAWTGDQCLFTPTAGLSTPFTYFSAPFSSTTNTSPTGDLFIKSGVMFVGAGGGYGLGTQNVCPPLSPQRNSWIFSGTSYFVFWTDMPNGDVTIDIY